MSCSLESELKENSSNIHDSVWSCNHEGVGSLDSANSGLADYSVISDSACSCTSHVGTVSIGSVNSVPANYASENFLLGERNLAGISRNPQSLKSFLDLTGDYNSHVRSVKYARNFHLNGSSVHVLPSPPILPQSNKSHWETARQSLQLKQNVHPQINTNTILGRQPYSANQVAPFYAASNYEEKEKRRGTGTYIPNMSYHSNRDRFSPRRGRNLVTGIHSQLHKHGNTNGLATSPKATSSSEHSHDISEAEYPPLGNGKLKLSVPQQCHQHGCGSSNANGSLHTLEEVDSGPQSLNAQEVAQPETMDWPDLSASYPQASASRTVTRTGQSPKLALENEKESSLWFWILGTHSSHII
uniref:Uncharacterized protein LOC105123210 n=1 Tax=Rhizophora mucronata TaxID=61149 RepID=A0A2P2IRK1_RHIMU